jgi:hypothetical protein
LFQDATKAQPHSSHPQKPVDPDTCKRSATQKSSDSAPKRSRRNDSNVDEDRDGVRTVNTQNAERDEFSTFGEHVAFKLRNLKDRRSQSIAQFEISRILFQIEMGNFGNSTHFNTGNVCPGVEAPCLGTVASQIPPALSPAVLIQSATSPVPDSASPLSQIPKLSPLSLHSNGSIAEDAETLKMMQ